jgi:hypothetical protein
MEFLFGTAFMVAGYMLGKGVELLISSFWETNDSDSE